jgi:hypothetical protein
LNSVRRGRRAASVGLFENCFPAFVDVSLVVEILFIELVFEPTIDPKLGVGGFGHEGTPS